MVSYTRTIILTLVFCRWLWSRIRWWSKSSSWNWFGGLDWWILMLGLHVMVFSSGDLWEKWCLNINLNLSSLRIQHLDWSIHLLVEFCRKFWLCHRQWCLVLRILGCPYSMSIVWLAILSTISFVFPFLSRCPLLYTSLRSTRLLRICWPKEFESNCPMLFNQQLGYRQLYLFLCWA